MTAVDGVIGGAEQIAGGKTLAQATQEADDAYHPLTNLVTFVILAVLPGWWIWVSRVDPLRGTLLFLGLTKPVRDSLVGLLAALVLLLVSLAYDFAWGALVEPLPANTSTLGFPLFLFGTVFAGVALEVFFRGLLQRFIGIWGQAALYVALVVPSGHLYFIGWGLILAMALGLLRVKTGGIVAPIVASVLMYLGSYGLGVLGYGFWA